MLHELEQQILISRKMIEAMFGVSLEPSFADKVQYVISVVTYTILWWLLLIPVTFVKSLVSAVKDLIEE